MNKPKLNRSSFGVSIRWLTMDRCYQITYPGGRHFCRDRAKADEIYHNRVRIAQSKISVAMGF
jgi:hypothetical protein